LLSIQNPFVDDAFTGTQRLKEFATTSIFNTGVVMYVCIAETSSQSNINTSEWK